VNFVYQIPLLRNSSNHLLKATVGGWELSGIVTAQTGTPLNIGCTSTCGASYATVANVFPGGDVLVRPDLAGPVSYPKTVNAWFSGSSFAAPAAGTWGNLGFNALRGPGRQNWNLSLFKSFTFGEERRLELRAESFNVWNHTEFNQVSNGLGSSNFGQVTSAFDPRVFQFGAKIYF